MGFVFHKNQFSANFFIITLALNLVLIGDHVKMAEAIKKKKLMKQIMQIVPLIAMLKPKKKIIILPSMG